MRRKSGGVSITMMAALLFMLLTISSCDRARTTAQRRKDTARSDLYLSSPSAESLHALAQAMGAAGFESYTEGKTAVKRLFSADSQPDLDVVKHQGVIGKAGVDFPAFPNIPNTGFNCKNVPSGYYADLETDCQVFHICDTSRKISFLCPNGTIFSQSHLICDWWFKVDCASAPALYESSAEYYYNEQKKSQKIKQSQSKNADLQQIGADSNIRQEARRAPMKIPSTTERLLTHKKRLLENAKATSRSFQALFPDITQRTQVFEKRKTSIANNFGGNVARNTLPPYTEVSTYTTTAPVDSNSVREMQVAAETASFANRNFLQNYNSKNFRTYSVYTPNYTGKLNKPKSNPTLTTLYDIRDKHLNLVTQESTTKRPTLVPYTKSYASTINVKREPYTRPGVSLLKNFLEKEKNISTTTENIIYTATERLDIYKNNVENKITIDTKDTFESATKIPQTKTGDNYYGEAAWFDRLNIYSSTNNGIPTTTESSYQERRQRLLRNLNLGAFGPTEQTSSATITKNFYEGLPIRPGLVVPPSLTPKTLHTLAIYYATALDNLSTTTFPQETETTTTTAIDEYEALEDGLPALFSRHTINKYSILFGQGKGNSELLADIKFDPNGTYNELADDLTVQQSQNPFATSPQIRELAQVFTHALSAYLQDPVQFRKLLSDKRPTHPSFGDMLTTTVEPSNTEPTTIINTEDDEILGFSDDNKERPLLASLRDPNALQFATDYPTIPDGSAITPKTSFADISTTTKSSTPRSPFRCCGRISASYTSASTPRESSTTPLPYTNTVAANVNTLANNYTNLYLITTENSYFPKHGRFQNNSQTDSTPYGRGINPSDAEPLREYIEVTNLPTAWGVDSLDVTPHPVTNSHANIYESKKTRATTVLPTTPVYFTETDSVELGNEEELQRVHSQSFIAPQSNNLSQVKQIHFEEAKTIVKKLLEELEAPTLPDFEISTQTTTHPTTTGRIKNAKALTTVSSNNILTSPDSTKTTYQFQWPSTFESWKNTVIDPITLNNNLSPSTLAQFSQQVVRQMYSWSTEGVTTPSAEYIGTSEPNHLSSDNIELFAPGTNNDDGSGRLLKDPTSTELAQDMTTNADTVVDKAKEIMGGLNLTTTEKLMNVMKKSKSKTVKRLILLLIQTCDDDYNTTAEASKKALFEALMAVSQKDMDEIARGQGVTTIPSTHSDYSMSRTNDSQKREERVVERSEVISQQTDRRGKSLNFEATAINSLNSASMPESIKQTEYVKYVTSTLTTKAPVTFRRGTKKYAQFERRVEPPSIDSPRAEARTAAQTPDVKTAADTRAFELLRSLYTIAARWG